MKECRSCHRCLEDRHPVCPDDGAPLEEVFEGRLTLDGKYRLVRRLGGGGMGRVYKARHLGLKRLVSVKILRPRLAADERFVSRFEREAEVLGRLDHRNIVEVTDFGVDPVTGVSYLVMEYLEGSSLAERLRAFGPLAAEEALPIFGQIADALDRAHAAGILHRDLKPANVFLADGGAEAPVARVLDFGLARFFADPEDTPAVDARGRRCEPAGAVAAGVGKQDSVELTAPGNLAGTPGYVAPEVLGGGRATPASDVYAFGVLIYGVLVGQPPFRGSAAEVADMTLEREPRRPSAVNPELAAELDAPILAALARDPGSRPASARRVVAGLRHAARRWRRRRWRRRQTPGRLVLASLLGLAGALLTTILETPLRGVENLLVDARFYASPARPPSHPLVLVLIDEPSLAADPTPLIDRAGEVAELMRRVLEAGAAGVGIDLLLPPSWSRSAAFSDFVLRHADSLALAAHSPAEGPVIGPEAVSGLTAAALGPTRTEGIFGFVNLDQDGDGAVRRARAAYRDVLGESRASFAARMARILQASEQVSEQMSEQELPMTSDYFWIDFTIDWRLLETVSWRDLGSRLEDDPGCVRDRFVLVGATYAGSGDGPYRVPHPRAMPGEVSGPMLQALTGLTLLEGAPLRKTPAGRTAAAAGVLTALSTAAVLLARRFAPVAAVTATAVWVAAAYALFVRGGLLLPVAPFLAALLVAAGAAALSRRRMAAFPP